MSGLHAFTGEHSRFRRWALYLFARYLELPLLGSGYQMLRGRYRRMGQSWLMRVVLSWAVAAPFGYLGDTGRPMPAPKVLELLDDLQGPIAVGPCRCRGTHHGCNHPVETDIVIRTGVEAWSRAFPHDYRIIDKQEARQIVEACRRQGLWQMVFIHCPVNQQNEYVICNCCTCGCVPYILNRELGQRAHPLLKGKWASVTNPARCTGHGACLAACPFGARALQEGRAQVVNPCFGCGLCVDACPEGAITMQEAQRA
jgi:NAD-dependent dihydropyrimidine dehydrogenase PreA subunit